MMEMMQRSIEIGKILEAVLIWLPALAVWGHMAIDVGGKLAAKRRK